ncbi:hypothetical protein [Ottowia thiooxydans]|uniref:ATP-grasp domain-containing protein n=1 Tax=Ottowia thiooxydans TaxID=219182 RepID=A0ABV2Q324_9BURK
MEAILLEDVPEQVLLAACKSASLVGDGFYGVDIKVQAGKAFVIEINDNPNLDAGVEDAKQGDEVYRKILRNLLRSFESRHNHSEISKKLAYPENDSHDVHDTFSLTAKSEGCDDSTAANLAFAASSASPPKGVTSLRRSA